MFGVIASRLPYTPIDQSAWSSVTIEMTLYLMLAGAAVCELISRYVRCICVAATNSKEYERANRFKIDRIFFIAILYPAVADSYFWLAESCSLSNWRAVLES